MPTEPVLNLENINYMFLEVGHFPAPTDLKHNTLSFV